MRRYWDCKGFPTIHRPPSGGGPTNREGVPVSDWKIEAVKADEHTTTHDLLISFLVARRYWRRLTKLQRAAVEHGYKHGLVDAHVSTMASLERHGFMHPDCRLTDAGKAVAKWNQS